MKKTSIVDHVFTLEEIKEIKWTLSDLLEFISKKTELEAAVELGLVGNTSICDSCNKQRALNKRSKLHDGFVWNCPSSSCKSTATVRKGSFLEKSRLRIRQIVILLYCWSLDMKQYKIQKEIDVSEHTIVYWMNFIREICEQDILDHPVKLGGIDEKTNKPKEVEINKSYFFNRKYSRGRYKDEVLVFQVFEQESKLSNLTTVKSRDRSALFPIIRSWLLPGTRIVSDGWADYEGLEKFEHRIKVTLDEKCSAADPMIEILWRRRENGEVFPRILKCIREQYSF